MDKQLWFFRGMLMTQKRGNIYLSIRMVRPMSVMLQFLRKRFLMV